jgi:hypothetical protein
MTNARTNIARFKDGATLGELVADTFDHVARSTVADPAAASRAVASILHRRLENSPRLNRLLF